MKKRSKDAKRGKRAAIRVRKAPARSAIPKRRRVNNSATRAPLTVALGPESFRFIQSCAKRKEFRNVDDLFEAALLTYQRQTDALRAYTEMQIDKGFTREEILDSLRLEFVFTRLRRTSRSKSRAGSSGRQRR